MNYRGPFTRSLSRIFQRSFTKVEDEVTQDDGEHGTTKQCGYARAKSGGRDNSRTGRAFDGVRSHNDRSFGFLKDDDIHRSLRPTLLLLFLNFSLSFFLSFSLSLSLSCSLSLSLRARRRHGSFSGTPKVSAATTLAGPLRPSAGITSRN